MFPSQWLHNNNNKTGCVGTIDNTHGLVLIPIIMLQVNREDGLQTQDIKTGSDDDQDMLMNKYSTQNTLYHKTSLSAFSM